MGNKDICIDLIDGKYGKKIKTKHGTRIAMTLKEFMGIKGYSSGLKNGHTICFEDVEDAERFADALKRNYGETFELEANKIMSDIHREIMY